MTWKSVLPLGAMASEVTPSKVALTMRSGCIDSRVVPTGVAQAAKDTSMADAVRRKAVTRLACMAALRGWMGAAAHERAASGAIGRLWRLSKEAIRDESS
ncbi:hypothetical protein GCM10027021_26480 [Dyella kyungheensis]